MHSSPKDGRVRGSELRGHVEYLTCSQSLVFHALNIAIGNEILKENYPFHET